jgi:hypothetical protein
MSDTVLLLGPIAFTDFEVPAGVSFGGRQRLAIHRLPGGARIIDALGRDDAALTFCGIFSGNEATLRARSVDELRALGLPLPLTWDVFFYSVVIDQFQADYQNSHWIPYRITCTVIRDEAAAVIETGISLATSAISDISNASISASIAGIDLSETQTVISATDATTNGTSAFAATRSSLAGAQLMLGTGLTKSEASLTSIRFTDTTTAAAGITNISRATSAAGQISQIAQSQSFLGRAAVNLANAST